MSGSDAPPVYAIVLNWNGYQDTLDCLAALAEDPESRVRVLVVDNGSTDGSEARLRDAWPDIELIQTGENLGFAGGMNVGIRYAAERGAAYVWLLNNDTRPQRGALAGLVTCADSDGSLGALSSRVVRLRRSGMPGESYDTAFIRPKGRLVPIRCEGAEGGNEPCRYAERLYGVSLLLRMETIARVGLLDERYFHYYEEIDLIERMRRAGWQVGLSCRSLVLHGKGRSLADGSPQSRYYRVRNQLMFQHKFSNSHPLQWVAANPREALRRIVTKEDVKRRDLRRIHAQLLGVIDAVRGRTGKRDFGPTYWSKS